MKKEKCYMCEIGLLDKKQVDFSLYGVLLGKFNAEVCSSCGEQFFDESSSDAIDAVAKEKGLWGLEAQTKITQSGSSIAVTIAKPVAEFMQLHKGQSVQVHPESKKKLVIEIV